MTALPGYKASVYITTTPSVAFTNEATSDAGDHKNYTITNAVKRYWDNSQALTIQTSPDGTTWTTVTTGFTVNYCGGIITFASAISGATPSCRVSGYYLPYSLLGGATSVELQTTVDIADVTSLGGNGWKQKLAMLVDATFKLSKWWMDNFFLSAITSSTRLVISMNTGANANQRFDAFCYIKQDDIKIDLKSPITESIDLEVDGGITAISS